MNRIEKRKLGSLSNHPKNQEFFGNPDDAPNYESIRKSIERHGIQEPVIVRPDGTILSGHVRVSIYREVLSARGLTQDQVNATEVQVRVNSALEDDDAEIRFLIESNVNRRHLAADKLAILYEQLVQIYERESRRPGRPKGAKNKDPEGPRGRRLTSKEKAAKNLGISRPKGEALISVYRNPLVSESLREEVKQKRISQAHVVQAVKYVTEQAKREGSVPTTEDVEMYLRMAPRKTGQTILEAIQREPEVKEEEAPPTPRSPVTERFDPVVSFQKALGNLLEAPLTPMVQEAASKAHSRLGGYLEGLGVLPVAQAKMTLPETPEEQLDLCLSVVEGLDYAVDDPISVRDKLLEVSNRAKFLAQNLTQTERTFKKTGLVCSVCGSEQYMTVHGSLCDNNHGGVEGVPPEKFSPNQKPTEKAMDLNALWEDAMDNAMDGMPPLPPPPKEERSAKKEEKLPPPRFSSNDHDAELDLDELLKTI